MLLGPSSPRLPYLGKIEQARRQRRCRLLGRLLASALVNKVVFSEDGLILSWSYGIPLIYILPFSNMINHVP